MPIDRTKYSRKRIQDKMDPTSDELVFGLGNMNDLDPEDYIKAVAEQNEMLESINKLVDEEKKKEEQEALLKDSLATEDYNNWFTNFFGGMSDAGDLDNYYYSKSKNKWYRFDGPLNPSQLKVENGNEVDLEKIGGKEVTQEEVTAILDDHAKKFAKSGWYAAGKMVSNIEDSVISGLKDTGFTVGDVLGSVVGEVTDLVGLTSGKGWDKATTASVWNLWNGIKSGVYGIGKNAKHIGNYAQYKLGIDSKKEYEKDSYEIDKEYQGVESKLRKEEEQIRELGSEGYAERLKHLNRPDSEKSFLDKGFEELGKGWRELQLTTGERQDYYTKLNSLMYQRAMDIEGVQKQTLTGVDDETFDTTEVEITNPITGIKTKVPKNIKDENGSQSIWDVKKLQINPDTGQPDLDENGNPIYVNKYNIAEKIANSNFAGALTDKYYLTEDVGQGIGSMLGFVAGGSALAKGTGALMKGAGKGMKMLNRGMKLESRALNYTNKILNATGRTAITDAAFGAKMAKVSNGISTATRVALQDYLMTDTESNQIGRQVQREVINNSIDKAGKINREDVEKDLMESGKSFSSKQAYQMAVNQEMEQRREQFTKENPEIFKEIINRSIIAKNAAESANNINFVTNLTSAGLFVKGKSFSRNILKNPLDAKAWGKGLWEMTREASQEMWEEGVTNGFAEKFGAAAGELKFKTIGDFYRDNVGTSEFAESAFAGALLGGGNTALTNVSTLRGRHKSYKEQQAQIKELEKLGVIKDKDELVKHLQTLVSKTRNEDVAKKMNDYLSQGEFEKASQLSDYLLLSTSVDAAATGTTEVLAKQFNELLKSDALDEDQKAEIRDAIELNEKIADEYDSHINYANRSQIASIKGQKHIFQRRKETLQNLLNEKEAGYDETVNRLAEEFAKREGVKESDENYEEKLAEQRRVIEGTGKEVAESNNRVIKEYNTIKNRIDEYQQKIEGLEVTYDTATDPKKQKELLEKLEEASLLSEVSNVTEDTKEEVKKNLKEKGKLTEKLSRQIDQIAEEKRLREVNETEESVKREEQEKKVQREEKKKQVEQQVKAEVSSKGSEPVKEAAKGFSTIIKNNEEQKQEQEKPIEVKDEDADLVDDEATSQSKLEDIERGNLSDILDFQPMEVEDSNPKHNNIIQGFSNIIKSLKARAASANDAIFGRKEAFNMFINEVGFDVAERYFKLFAKAYDNLIGETFNSVWSDIYQQYYSPLKDFKSVLKDAENPTSEQVVAQNTEIQQKTIQENNPKVGRDIVGNFITYMGTKTAEAVNKIPYLGTLFTEVNNDGVVSFKQKGMTLNQHSGADLSILLDPNNLVPGTEFEIQIAKDVAQRDITVYENREGVIVSVTKNFQKYCEEKGIQEDSEEWIKLVPMDMVVKGKVVGPAVHSYYWWNEKNIANFQENLPPQQARAKQRAVIESGRQKTLATRQAVLNGNTKFEITKREGIHTIENETGELKSIKDSNPDMIFAVATASGFKIDSDDNGAIYFPPGETTVAKEFNINEHNGHLFGFVQVNTRKDDTGKVVKVYTPVKLHTNYNQEALKKLRGSMDIIWKAHNILTGKQRATEQEQQWAKQLEKDVRKVMGLSLSLPTDVMKIQDYYPNYKKEGEDKGSLFLKIQMDRFAKKQIAVVTEDGTVTPYEGGYKAMLQDHIGTEKIFSPIITESGKTFYVYNVQPTIQYEQVSNQDNGGKQITEKKEQETNIPVEVNTEVIEPSTNQEENPTDSTEIIEPVESLEVPVSRKSKKDVITHIYNKTLKALGNLDTEHLTPSIIKEEIRKSYNEYIQSLEGKEGFKTFSDYIKDNEKSILGIEVKEPTSVLNLISEFLSEDLNEDIELSNESVNEKNNGQASYERDVRTSLSTRLKLFFAGIERTDKNLIQENKFYSPDEVLGAITQVLTDIDNTKEAFENAIKDKIEKNPKEFAFLQEALDKFNNAPLEVQNEMLYRLNQTNIDMFFIAMIESQMNGYKIQDYDSNSKNPIIRLQREFKEALKTSEELINHEGDYYTLKMDKAKKLLHQYNTWTTKANEIHNREFVDWLSNFGIQVFEKTIQDLKDGKAGKNSIFENMFSADLNPKATARVSVFHTLAANLSKAVVAQENNPDVKFGYKTSEDYMDLNILTDDNGKHLKTLVKLEVINKLLPMRALYDNGKTIMPVAQPNFASEQTRKLRGVNSQAVKNLKQTPFAKNSLLLKLLLTNEAFRQNFNIGYVGLTAIQELGKKLDGDFGITNLSEKDYTILLQGFFASKGIEITNGALEEKGIKVRGSKMTFPTLSDSSQMFLLDTFALDLKSNNFEFKTSSTGTIDVTIDENVTEVLFEQLVKPDLERMYYFLKSNQNSNIQGIDLGSQIFTILPALNTLKVPVKDADGKVTQNSLLAEIHSKFKNGSSIQDIVDLYKEQIYANVNETIQNSAKTKLQVQDGKKTGTWVEREIIREGKNSVIDNKYLQEKRANQPVEAELIAAYDFTINYYINQAQIQMLYAGDIANYVKDKAINDFNEKDVTKPKADDTYKKIMEVASVNMSKRLKELISPGNRKAERVNEKYIQIQVNDVENSSTTIQKIADLFYPEKSKFFTEDFKNLLSLEKSLEEGLEKGIDVSNFENAIDTVKKKLKKEFPEIKNYFEITSTDAQEYTTWGEHLDMLKGQGRITLEDYNNIKEKLEKQSEDVASLGKVRTENRLTKEEKKVVFQPLKPLHAGLYYDNMVDLEGKTILDENGEEMKHQKFVYIKTSSFPLLPEMTQTLKLDKLRKTAEQLEKNRGKRVRISYQSGNKVGAVKKAMNVQELYQNYSEALEQKINDSSIELDRENFSIQQDKPFKADKNIKKGKRDEVGLGTQFEKIILGNNINKITQKIFPNTFDTQLLDRLGIKLEDNKISGEDLYNVYIYIAKENQRLLTNKLLRSLGVKSFEELDGNFEVLENIKRLLNQRLSNQQDKELLEIRYKALKVNKDGSKVYDFFTKEEIEKHNLKPISAEFNVPLWISPNSRKFESVLNSIVNKALINLKSPGFSSPVASQEGFVYKEEGDVTSDGIIYTDSYNPSTGLTATYTEDGKLKSAQVMVASKFKYSKKDKNGKTIIDYIDLTKYLKEDGKTLDTSKLDPSLLEMFSFRIPTSAHQSGAIIEIVGFLPKECGDLMVVPKDHTVQLGEDYDIDTRYVYSQNYYMDKEGNIKKVDSEYTQSKIAEIDSRTNNEVALEEAINDVINTFTSIKENEDIQEALSDKRETIKEKAEAIKDNLKLLLLENQMVDMYKSVYKTTDANVQKMIGSVLSTDVAEETAELIDAETKTSSLTDSTFSIFDDAHQAKILKLGASGKLGIGVHSNWVVLNSIMQQSKQPLTILGKQDSKGNFEPYRFRLGAFESTGKLGLIEALNPHNRSDIRTLATINMENQNCATDNQKLQIMGRRNENKYTINAFALMCNLGFDVDITENNKKLHIPSLLISQPIIKRYVELMEAKDSVVKGDEHLSEEDIIKKVAQEFDTEGKFFEIEEDKIYFKAVEQGFDKDLTVDNLFKELSKSEPKVSTQLAAFEQFLEMNRKASQIQEVQKLLNIDKGLGKSFFDTLQKKDKLIGLLMYPDNYGIDNVSSLIGDVYIEEFEKSVKEIDETNSRELTDEYIKIEEGIYVKPTTPLGAKLVNSISIGYNLWNNFMPYESKHIRLQINSILTQLGVDGSTKRGLELKYKIISEMKDYLYSYQNVGIYDMSINDERNKLFIDTDTNTSLATFLMKLKKEGNELFEEDFFKDLDFSLNKKTKPSIIKYNTSNSDSLDKNSVYRLFEELDSEPVILGEFNGNKNYSTKDLVKDLLKYSLLASQENGAIGFRQYIPVSIMEKYGVSSHLRKAANPNNHTIHSFYLNNRIKGIMDMLGTTNFEQEGKFIPNNNPNINKDILRSLVEKTNTMYGEEILEVANGGIKVLVRNENLERPKFADQFFRHNSHLLPKIKSDIILDKNGDTLAESTIIELDPYEKSIVEAQGYLTVKDENGNTQIYRRLSYGTFERVSKLGSHGFNEYLIDSEQNKSAVEENNFKENTSSLKKIQKKDEYTQPEDNVNDFLFNIEASGSEYAPIAKLLRPFIRDGIKIHIEENTAQSKFAYNALYLSKDSKGKYNYGDVIQYPDGSKRVIGDIYLAQRLLQSGDTKKIQKAILEELLHSATVDYINQFVNTKNSYYNEKGELNIDFNPDENTPAHIIKLVQLFKEGSKVIFDKYTENGTAKDAIDKLNSNRQFFAQSLNEEGQKPETSEKQRDVYRTINLGEFIAGIFLDEDFRQTMNEVKYKQTDKSIFKQFIDTISKLIKSVVGKVEKDSISEHTVAATLEVLYSDRNENKTKVKKFGKTRLDEEVEKLLNNNNLREEEIKILKSLRIGTGLNSTLMKDYRANLNGISLSDNVIFDDLYIGNENYIESEEDKQKALSESQAIYLIGDFNKIKETVKKLPKKPIFAYLQKGEGVQKEGWYKLDWTTSNFSSTGTPLLSKNSYIEGFGELSKSSEKAGKELLLKTQSHLENAQMEKENSKPVEDKGIIDADFNFDFNVDFEKPEKVYPEGELDFKGIKYRTIPLNGKYGATNQDAGIRIDYVTKNEVEDFWNYFEGKKGGVTSQQKSKVLEALELDGYSLDKIKSILDTTKKINAFLILHEYSHLKNEDWNHYPKLSNVKYDMLNDKAINIETRATIDALKTLEDLEVLSNKISILEENLTKGSSSKKDLLNSKKC